MILSFNFDWFTTVPGMLIAGGVVLLIIAVILFIVGGKKASEEETSQENFAKEEMPMESVNEEVNLETNASPVEIGNTQNEVSINNDLTSSVSEIPVEEAKVEPVISFDQPVVEPVQSEPVVNFDEPVSIPVEEPTPVEIPNVAVEIPAEEDFEKTQISVFGDNVASIEEPKTSIYGGNDPLEATQNLPKVDEHHEPYGGVEVKIVEPVDEAVVEIPQAEPINVEVNEQFASFEVPVQEQTENQTSDIEEL